MRSIRYGRGIVAMEEEQARLDAAAVEAEENRRKEGEQAEAAADERVQEAVETQDDLQELDAQADDVDVEHEAVEEAMDTVEALEALREVVKAGMQAGNINRTAAGSAIAMLSYADKMTGYVPEQKISLESFDGISSAKRTAIALEAEVTARIKKIYEAIKQAILRSIEWVKNFVISLFKTAEKLKAKAADIEKKYKDVHGKPSEATFASAKLHAALVYEGDKVPDDATGARAVGALVNTIYGNLSRVADSTLKTIEAAGASNDMVLSIEKRLGLKSIDKSKVDLHGLDADSAEVEASDALPGNAHFVSAFDSNGNGFMKIQRLKGASESAGKDVPYLSTEVADRQVEEVLKFASQIVSSKAAIDNITRVKKKMLASVDKKALKADDELTAGFAKAFHLGIKMMDQPFVAVSGYAVRTGYALLEQAEQSYKATAKQTKAA
jgi:hypothetical protein